MAAMDNQADGFKRPQLLSESVYRELKTLILTNQLRPGEALVEERIAAQWGISRTPLRAALTRLEKDGLVAIIPHRGCVVTDLHPEDVRDIYQVREALEVVAVQLATPHIPQPRLDAMQCEFDAIEAELAQDRYERYIVSDAEFHALIIEHVPNRLLVTMLEGVYDRITRVRNYSHTWPGEHMRLAFNEHRCILDALQRRDAAAAAEAMRVHLRNGTPRAIELLHLQPVQE
jgi:GntR family transcriptional regulator, rspAB operon transcriptional repressor